MRKTLFRIGAVLLLLIVAAAMMYIGRGHTVYFDNKNLEYNGEKYEAVRRMNVFVNGEQVAKLGKKERGMATGMGQRFHFDVEVIREKDGPSENYSFDLDLPYGTDGIIVNLPGIIAALPEEAWMSEFVPKPVVEEEDEEIVTDEFDMDLGDV